jgi:hypothetical protein
MTATREARLTELGFVWEPGRNKNGGGISNEVEWEAQLARLVAYKAAQGDCSVPRGWAEDRRLSNWVNNQRKLKRKFDRGEPSDGMAAERVAKLTALGFVWNIGQTGGEAKWETQLARLAAYRVEHGDCNVPACWAKDPQFGHWVSRQRGLKRKLDRGEPSNEMTAERASRLTELGFVWPQSSVRVDQSE